MSCGAVSMSQKKAIGNQFIVEILLITSYLFDNFKNFGGFLDVSFIALFYSHST